METASAWTTDATSIQFKQLLNFIFIPFLFAHHHQICILLFAKAMAMRNEGECEILVHISAPSGGGDDARYRSLALAYLAFEPIRRESTPQEDKSKNAFVVDNIDSESQSQDELGRSQYEDLQRPRIPLLDDADGSYQDSPSQAHDSFRKSYLTRSHLKKSLGSPQASFGSVLDNVNSPGFRPHAPVTGPGNDVCTGVARSQEWETPPSEVADSQSPFLRPIPQFSTPTRILELYLQQFPMSMTNSDESPRAGIRRHGELDCSFQGSAVEADHCGLIGDVAAALTSEQIYEEPDPIILTSPAACTQRDSFILLSNEEDTTLSLQFSSPSPIRPDPKTMVQKIDQEVTSDGTITSEKDDFNRSNFAEDTITSEHLSNNTTCPRLPPPMIHHQEGRQGPSMSSNFPQSFVHHENGHLDNDKFSSSIRTCSVNSVDPQRADNICSDVLKRSSPACIAICSTLPLERSAAQAGTAAILPRKRKRLTEAPEMTNLSSLPSISQLPTVTSSSPTLIPSKPSQSNGNSIYAPAPPTSISTRALALLTPSLIKLASTLNLLSRYRPVTQTRPLRPLERGYWAVCTDTWGVDVKERAWNALGVYVRGGRAGWGIWCARGHGGCKSCEETDRGEVALGKYGYMHEDGEWRIYCWGDVVGHIYLLLYLVSERRVKGTGARWVDGGGELVIVMENHK